MTTREQKIIKALLDVLHELDGGQLAEVILHAEVNLRLAATATKAEFDEALLLADRQGWVTGVTSRYGRGRLWNLNDAGSAARKEMR